MGFKSEAGAKEQFNFDNYSIIGFDLDGTLLRYNLKEMIPLEYQCLSNSLQRKGYPVGILKKPINLDFLQRGLILDDVKGNLLKLNSDGVILKAYHGDKELSEKQIVNQYGEEKKWHVSSEFIKNPLNTWNGPYSEQMRTILDYFDLPVSLVHSRAVTTLNQKDPRPIDYNIWLDILDGLNEMYRRESFNDGTSEYFKALKSNPEKYIIKTSPKVIEWLKYLKNEKGKALYLLTGSDISFANFTASYALGENWRDLFDCVVCFAKKPGFFVDNSRCFYQVDIDKKQETDEIPWDGKLYLNNVYSRGCWDKLKTLLKQKTGETDGRSLYIGDNLIQDVLCPVRFSGMDSIAISEEMFAEGVHPKDGVKHVFNDVTKSTVWGSYFELNNQDTLWASIIEKYSKICVPTVDYLVDLNDNDIQSGFYPNKPKTTT